MDAIINDFSLNGQYETPEEFFDSLVKYTLPAFQSLVRQGCNILKSYTTYARKISKDVTLHDVLRMPQFRGYPEATRLKTFLVSCSEPPYWSDDSQTDCTQEYSVAQLSAEDMSLPNCITEAVTRNTAILSFFDPNFMDLKIPVYKNSQKYELQNIYNNESAGQALFLNGLIGVADGLFCREIDGLFCRSSPDIIVRRRCVLSHKRRGWLQPSPSFRYSRNLALQDELYHPVINNGPAVLVCVDKRLGTGPVNQSRDAG